jgi:hypothetical protein
MMATDFRKVHRENVNRHYDRGGLMIALTDTTIEMGGEPLHIPKGHRLTREQALNYAGDVEYVNPDAAHQGAPKCTRMDSRQKHAGMTKVGNGSV